MTAPFPPFQLNNGISMPPVALGCSMGTSGTALEVENMVKNAIDAGYQKIDTAST
jgi:diketogulonate reductase-like aldo/keto reductase